MDEEVDIDYNGKTYTVPYSINGDELSVYFSDGIPRMTMLRGLTIKTAARA